MTVFRKTDSPCGAGSEPQIEADPVDVSKLLLIRLQVDVAELEGGRAAYPNRQQAGAGNHNNSNS